MLLCMERPDFMAAACCRTIKHGAQWACRRIAVLGIVAWVHGCLNRTRRTYNSATGTWELPARFCVEKSRNERTVTERELTSTRLSGSRVHAPSLRG